MSRAAARQISFADWELMRQGLVRLEPLLQAISDFLDDQKEMIERVRSDLVRGLKKPGSGRSGLTPQQVLRSLVLMRRQELGLSRAARTDRRRIDAAPVHRVLLRAGAQARRLSARLHPADTADAQSDQ